MRQYRWKGWVSLPVDAQTVGERIEKLRRANSGFVGPKLLIEDARPPDAPLHHCFEWNDDIAAELYREDQAKYMLRHIVVEIPDSSGQSTQTIRAFVNIETVSGPEKYTSMIVAMSDSEMRRQILQRAWRELQTWQERYREYEELAAIFNAMDSAKEKISALG